MRLTALFKDTFFYGTATVIQRLMSLAVIPLYVSSLSVSEFGFISLFQFFLGIGMVFFLVGVDQALLREASGASRTAQKSLFFTALTAAAAAALAVSAVTLAFRGPVTAALFRDTAYAGILPWLLGVTALECVCHLAGTLLRSRGMARAFAAAASLKMVFFFACNWFLLTRRGWGVEAFLVSFALSGGLYLAVTAFTWVPALTGRFDRAVCGRMVRFGLPLAANVLLTVLLFQSDQYLLERFRGLAAVGVYAFGYKFGSVLYYLVSSLNNAWFPHLFRIGETELRESFRRTFMHVQTASFAAFLGLDFFFRVFYRDILPDRYRDAIPVLSWVGLGYVLFNMGSFIDSLFYQRKRPHWIPVITLTALAVNVGLNLWWIPRYGITGAAVSTFLSFAAYLGATLALARRLNFPVAWSEPLRRLAAFAAVYAVGRAILSMADGTAAGLAVWLSAIPLLLWVTLRVSREARGEWGRMRGLVAGKLRKRV
ncbi:oligosaccharide flippase family protein [bacterium]|nr:oligosaccharide flippase family protein [bacterium]